MTRRSILSWVWRAVCNPWFQCVVFVVISLLLLGLATDALARVGGGSSYSGGSSSHSSSSSSSGGGSSSSGSSDGLFLLIWLCIEHPIIGIPLTIIVIGFVIAKKLFGGSSSRASNSPVGQTYQPKPQSRRKGYSVDEVRQADPNFSEPAFLDFAQVIYTRVHQERAKNRLEPLQAWLTPKVVEQLALRSKGVTEVNEVIFGATQIESSQVKGSEITLTVYFDTNMNEVQGGKTEQWLLHERWHFMKSSSSLSPPPATLVSMSCPSCGNPAETRLNGTCVHCDTPVGGGKVLWQVQSIDLVARETVKPPPMELGSGVEGGTNLPTVFHPQFSSQLRGFQSRHPEFEMAAFKVRVKDIFVGLQNAWSNDRWQEARPLETDHLYQTHRYWVERFRKYGLRNKMEQIQVLDVVPAKIGSDAFYEAFTVRIKARMIDYTIDKSGTVVGGDRKTARTFTEYWTFIRSAGKSVKPREKLDSCPSCGASLDKVTQSGICGYCDAKITSGDHDWVLSSIEQDDAYAG